ncbi:hypothetical protein [Leptotrichia buccalis]|uniref:Uncharacterized protein n=1 Tax=Leptotrichia buccalis (strain ATCC 14201 / DSM 1135 / JCM 12969 / NCTC 10249 / C-1013-b) TaxID=523794 RepID=C7NCN6_LEPBD|nr:hypothetical protein [Leptotrichia buccalis]ACV39882.1 hypothetical protein Lebu_2020 [Leptotrichia buccalis C-1013-b]
MKEFLLNLENKDKIGIYRFDTDGFSVGNIIKIWDNYLLLKSYDTQNDEDGIKIYQIDKIQRIILDSDYIKNLGTNLLDKTESSYEWLYTKNLNSIDAILENIIKGRTLVFLHLKDETTEICYIAKKIGENYLLEILDYNLNVTSTEIISKDYIRLIKFFDRKKINKDFEVHKVKLFVGKTYIGNIVMENGNFLVLKEIPDFENEKFVTVIQKKFIEEISKPFTEVKYIEKINLNKYFKNINELDYLSILKICQENNLFVFIDNENFEESKVGIVTGLENERLQLKTLDKNLQFVEILNINYSDIHILYITNYCYKKLNQTF